MAGDAFSDIGAEITLLATLLEHPDAGPAVWNRIAPSDLYRPVHCDLAALMSDLGTYDPQQVMTTAIRRGQPEVATLLPSLVGRATLPAQLEIHASTIRDAARRRKLAAAVTAAEQQISNPMHELGETLVGLMTEVESLVETSDASSVPPIGLGDFLLGDDHYDWIVPDLIERSDRVMVTGGEGGGKSTWLRQIAVCVAAGINPVTFRNTEPRPVLIVDVENSRPLLRRSLRSLMEQTRRVGRPVQPDALRIVHKPGGIDLGQLDEVGWLMRQVELAKPDLLVIGPLYRLHTSALDKEEAARAITVALDSICARVGCALLLEAHAGHGSMGQRWWRPTGSSLFMRWAHFGLAIGKSTDDPLISDVMRWRGGRDERAWPERLRRGGPNGWPWLEAEPSGQTWSAA